MTSIIVHLFLNIISYLCSFLEEILENELAAGVFEDSVGHLLDGDAEVFDSVVGEAGVGDAVVDGAIDVDSDVVFCDDVLG